MDVSPKSIDSLNGIRAIACIIVLLGHLKGLKIDAITSGGAFLGVMLFFSLSGFLMAYHYMSCSTLKEWKAYTIRRTFRVYPAYVAVCMLMFVLHYLGVKTFLPSFGGHDFMQHALLQGGTPIFWTIAVEMRFYLIFPLIAVFIMQCIQPKWRLHIVLIMFCLLLLMDKHEIKAQNDLINIGNYMEFFAAGVVGGYIYRYSPPPLAIKKSANIVFWGSMVLLILLFPRILAMFTSEVRASWKDGAVYSVLTGLMVLSAAYSIGVTQRILKLPVLQFIGNISFSIYLLHLLIYIQLQQHVSTLPAVIGAFIAIVITIFISWMLYKTVEQPFRRIGKHLAHKLSV